MPMDFPDMKSLESAAKCHGFRPPRAGETEPEYRAELANHVEPLDLVESMEIRTSVGWNKFSEKDNLNMLARSFSRNSTK